ncbi:MAG: vitamin K epoxide reductase family protein [Acidobacteriota bacterium]|nr:vitamin K epoxide reductase family protein [Acidobacteriota bacterium]MDE3161976.1 vitamin K epoxide reductase family protein [Acidobacteriota bacterium]
MRYLILVLGIAGAVVSGLALQVHYSTATEPCSINAHWDCGVVNHSPFAVLHGVPVAAIGIAGYLMIAALGFFRQRFALMLAVIAAFCFALRLTFIEELVLEVWCLYCVISQTIIALLLVLSVGWVAAEYRRLRSGLPSSVS